jgi:hypothetical protein
VRSGNIDELITAAASYSAAQATLGKKVSPVLVNPFTRKAYVLGHHIAVATRVIQPGAKFYY